MGVQCDENELSSACAGFLIETTIRASERRNLGRPSRGGLGKPRPIQPFVFNGPARASVGLCAESLGGAQKAMEIAIEYAKERIQFDQPIASYQSIKHYCSQMYLEVESARSMLYWAAWAQDHADDEEAALAASTAKSYLSEVYRNAAATAIQILGGTGFAWEHDIHLYIKRSKSNEIMLGDPAWHRERIMSILGA